MNGELKSQKPASPGEVRPLNARVIGRLDYGIAFSVVSGKSVSVLKLFVGEFWTEV